MNSQLTSFLARLPARRLNLVLMGALLIACALTWLLAVRAPLASLRTMRAERTRLETAAADTAGLRLQNERLAAEVAALSRDRGKADWQGSADQMLVHLISEVDRAGSRHGVQIRGTIPGPTRKTVIFDEIPFDIEARGSYQSLVDWMEDIERSLPTLSISRFEIHPTDTPPRLAMKIRIAAYRPLEGHP
ncbi:MAG TPA: type 4a pilus biogenesis protein PilO [Rhodocyclaceae bacterium]|nr:type 4a pilus biogenesis protein PilO [Rhodocyclaceae bacterium]